MPNIDYPNLSLDPGKYLFLITNDIRYLETTYSIDLNVNSLDWRFVNESIDETVDFSKVTEGISGSIDFGSITS